MESELVFSLCVTRTDVAYEIPKSNADEHRLILVLCCEALPDSSARKFFNSGNFFIEQGRASQKKKPNPGAVGLAHKLLKMIAPIVRSGNLIICPLLSDAC